MKKLNLVVLLSVFILVASCLLVAASPCGNSPCVPLQSTSMPHQATIIAWLTAQPTITPTLTKTPTATRTPKPPTPTKIPTQPKPTVVSNSTVTYVVTGSGPGAFLTLSDPASQYGFGTIQLDTGLPWSRTWYGVKSGVFLYVSAQIDGYGTITCQIYKGGKLIASETSSGQYVICTADYM